MNGNKVKILMWTLLILLIDCVSWWHTLVRQLIVSENTSHI